MKFAAQISPLLNLEFCKKIISKETQKVKIGKILSNSLDLSSGVPQGGILSPIIFTLFTADLEYWCKHSKIFSYADDTTSTCQGKDLKEILNHLEEDAANILSYMASNGLVANQAKTVFMVLNMKKQCDKQLAAEGISVGGTTVKPDSHTKLLGMTIESNQGWNEHFKGPNGLINALNRRTFSIRRIKQQIPHKNTMRVVQSIWMSKLRYGLQLCNKVRTTSTDPINYNMHSAQVAQNKMLRMLNGSSKTDHVSTKHLLEKFNLPSVNQLAAEIKIIEAWKIMNVQGYPITLDLNNPSRNTGDRMVRETTTRHWKDYAKLKNSRESFNIDTAKLWNQVNSDIKSAENINIAKSRIKKYCRTLEI